MSQLLERMTSVLWLALASYIMTLSSISLVLGDDLDGWDEGDVAGRSRREGDKYILSGPSPLRKIDA